VSQFLFFIRLLGRLPERQSQCRPEKTGLCLYTYLILGFNFHLANLNCPELIEKFEEDYKVKHGSDKAKGEDDTEKQNLEVRT